MIFFAADTLSFFFAMLFPFFSPLLMLSRLFFRRYYFAIFSFTFMLADARRRHGAFAAAMPELSHVTNMPLCVYVNMSCLRVTLRFFVIHIISQISFSAADAWF